MPLLDDPASALGLLTGRPVDLFWYDLPDLDLQFEYSKSYPVFAGLNAVIGGSITAQTNFDFGFDTSGFIEWQESEYDASQAWRIMKGFYLDDHGAENTPGDEDEVTLTAEIFAGLSLGIGGLVEAGVIGGIEAIIGFDLNDKLTEFQNGDPIGDGKMYGHELIERITHGPQCLFDVHGELSVFLEAFLWVGIDMGFFEITLFEARERFVDEVIASFSWECVVQAPERIASHNASAKELTLAYSGNASSGVHAYTVMGHDNDEEVATIETLFKQGLLDFDYYTSTELRNLSDRLASYSSEDLVLVSTGQRVEVYPASQVDTLTTSGTSGNGPC